MRPPHAPHAVAVFALILALTAACPTARADASWWSLGLLAGGTVHDDALADYQWDVSPRAAWGAQALAARGPLALGVRAWRSQTTQSLGDASAAAPTVRTTRLDALVLGRMARVAGIEAWAQASGGWQHLGYAPDQVTFTPAGGGSTVTVDFAPVDRWVFGAGTQLRAPLAGPWSLGLGVDRQMFSLDTAHRSGSEIVHETRSFGDWNARFEIAWNHRNR